MSNSDILKVFRWRFVGPYRGGRVMAVTGHPHDPLTYYFGSTGGGVWKTDNAGATWNNISDLYFKRATVGAIAIASSDPNVLYVGMGDGGFTGFNTHGDGVYKSVDAGQTWEYCGLAETQHIVKIRIHPHNSDIVFAAARGHLFGPNTERGVYRSLDGGRTWKQVQFQSEQAGAIDITIDPLNPRNIYASFWDAQRYPWGFYSGGENSRIYKSSDGGDTWTDLSSNPGLPKGVMGKIGISASPACANRVWALIEAEEGGVYRTDNGGDTWTWCNGDRNFLVRPRFFTHIVADPHDGDTVFLPLRRLWKSVDGGRTFAQVNTPYVDQHDVWISPNTPKHMILGSDGGASVSLNGGKNWSTLLNQPTAEIYRIAVDTNFPYRVYGSQQDNSTISLPSRSELGPISHLDWYDIGGGESGFIAVRPDNPNIVYSSDLPGLGITRYNRENLQIREIAPWSEAEPWDMADERFRFNWSTPVVLSPHDPDCLYVLGNVVFRTRNEGESWEVISPDLTRNDKSKMGPTGGPISTEGATSYCTLFSFSESPVEQGVLWVGSDDGLVHVSRDNGQTWTNVTPEHLPEWAETVVEASSHVAGRAFVGASAHRLDNFHPYLFKTDDYGQTWTVITDGIADNHFIRVVREDAKREGLLYAGTEVGVYVSLNNGVTWQPVKNNLPAAAVFDIATKDNDIAIATYGRGMWILDNLSPLQQWHEAIEDEDAHLFKPAPVYRVTRQIIRRDSLLELYEHHAAQNPPDGITVYYHLKTPPQGIISLELLDNDGSVIHHFTSKTLTPSPPEPLGAMEYKLHGGARLTRKPANEDEPGVKWGNTTFKDEPFNPVIPAEAGLNRFVIPMQYPGAHKIDGTLYMGITAPILIPGEYPIRLTVGDTVLIENVEVKRDPRVTTTHEEFERQFELMVSIRDKVTTIHNTVSQIRRVRSQLNIQIERLLNQESSPAYAQAVQLRTMLDEIEGELIQPALTVDSAEMEAMHHPFKLDHKLEALGYQVIRSDNEPIEPMWRLFDELAKRTDQLVEQWSKIQANQIPAFNQAIQKLNMPAIDMENVPEEPD